MHEFYWKICRITLGQNSVSYIFYAFQQGSVWIAPQIDHEGLYTTQTESIVDLLHLIIIYAYAHGFAASPFVFFAQVPFVLPP